jgi:hypothetical protein
METKWASLVSYGLTAQALKDFLSVDATLNATTVQNHTLTIAQRCEDELGEEQWAFVEGCLADWGRLPIPVVYLLSADNESGPVPSTHFGPISRFETHSSG